MLYSSPASYCTNDSTWSLLIEISRDDQLTACEPMSVIWYVSVESGMPRMMLRIMTALNGSYYATCVKLVWYSTFDIWYSTNVHHGPCASNATDIVAETQTAGDKLSSRPRPTPYFPFRYREKRRQFVTAWANGKSRRSLPLSANRVSHVLLSGSPHGLT